MSDQDRISPYNINQINIEYKGNNNCMVDSKENEKFYVGV